MEDIELEGLFAMSPDALVDRVNQQSKTIIHLLVDSEGTMFKRKQPSGELEGEVFFLGNPTGKADEIYAKTEEILKRHSQEFGRDIRFLLNIGKKVAARKLEQGKIADRQVPFVVCDVVCEELLKELGMSDQDAKNFRVKVEKESKSMRDPQVVAKLKAAFPNLNIDIILFTTANAFQEQAYREMLEAKGIKVIRANQYGPKNKPQTYRKLIEEIKEKDNIFGAHTSKFAFVDDVLANISAAQRKGIHASVQYNENGEPLDETVKQAVRIARNQYIPRDGEGK